MPKTKSAQKRVRSSERKRLHNRSIRSRLRRLEKKYLATLSAGQKDQAEQAFREVCSALDKAAKSGVIPKARADRKKSRLAAKLNALK